MKKLTKQQKLHLLNRAKEEAKKNKRTGKQRIAIPVNAMYVNTRRSNQKRIKQQFRASPPVAFNLMFENCVGVINYVNSIKQAASRRWDIIIDLSKVEVILEGAIAMLLSVLHEISLRRIPIGGNIPFNSDARLTLEKSGFLDHVSVRGVSTQHQKINFMRSGKKGDTKSFLSDQIKRAMRTIWGEEGRCQTLRNIIYEMIRNSCDHAFDPKNVNDVRWHLSISFDDDRKLVKFSLVDNGEGIPNTLVKSYLTTVKNLFKGDADMLESAFFGEQKSRTKLPWRGKGLPSIYESYSEGKIKNLLVISNGVFLHFDRVIKEDLSTAYKGTYYYWEIDSKCTKELFVD
jgi:hypothetical protein